MFRFRSDFSFLSAAHYWYRLGLSIVPIVPETKRSAVKWDPWLDALSPQVISTHWEEHPEHELGCIVGDDLVVLDADRPESVAAILELERRFEVRSAMVVSTSRGTHHYFRRAADTCAKGSSHSTEAYPERIDVKTGRALVILPPSTGKSIARCEISTIGDLTKIGQDFIDAVFRHNGTEPPREITPIEQRASLTQSHGADEALRQLASMVYRLDADCGYEPWLRILAAIHYETGGSEEGFALVHEWSSRGNKYCGERELRAKWLSFADYAGTPATIHTVRAMLEKQGDDWVEICAAAEPDFEVCECEVAPPTPEPPVTVMNVLTAFSLLGKLKMLKQEMVAQVHLLGELALMGQATVFYAAPNTGKTLLVLWLLIEAIQHGRVNPALVFYINVDDTLHGLVQKVHLAETYRFHMLSEGYQGFSAQDFVRILTKVMDQGQARGVLIVLDTLKKFTDLMDKRSSSAFGEVIRRFVLQGGTVIMLAHVNKKPGPDGRPIYAGTSDIVEDVDCAYTLRVISEPGAAEKVVEFENIKRRGDVAQHAVYAYCADGPYDQMLASVRRIADAEVTELNVAAETRADAEAVDVVCDFIRSGTNTRDALTAGVMTRVRWSRSAARALLDRYCGDDPEQHRWMFDVRARGAKVYRLHEIAEPRPESEPNTKPAE